MIEREFSKQGLLIRVVVVPRASRTAIAGEFDGALKIRLAAPPVNGAANKELIRHLSKKLGVPRSSISIRSGIASRRKTVLIEGANADVLERLGL